MSQQQAAYTTKRDVKMNHEQISRWFHDNDLESWISMTCIYCGAEGIYNDHVIPKSRGGKNGKNLVPACANCNSAKGTQTPLEWLGISNDEFYFGSPRHVSLAKARFDKRDSI